VAGGPAAAAGVAPGDVIVAIDGKPWTGVALSKLRNDLAAAPGRKVRLRMQGGTERTITLKDLV